MGRLPLKNIARGKDLSLDENLLRLVMALEKTCQVDDSKHAYLANG